MVFAEGSSDGDGGEVLAYPAKVTCGSVVKIVNKNSHLHLRSQEISYGSGSGLQAVTALENAEEAFNFWVRRAPRCHTLSLSHSHSLTLTARSGARATSQSIYCVNKDGTPRPPGEKLRNDSLIKLKHQVTPLPHSLTFSLTS